MVIIFHQDHYGFFQISINKTLLILASGNRKEALGKVDLKGKDIEEDMNV